MIYHFYLSAKLSYLIHWCTFQAAKEFETELKKEPEPNTEVLTDEPTTVSEEQKPEVKVPSSQEKV